MEVHDKVAIVTGAIGGIGSATIQCLLRNNVKVLVFTIASVMEIITVVSYT